METDKQLSTEELVELMFFQEQLEEEEFCCPDGTEPFPDFSIDLLEEFTPSPLIISAEDLGKLINSNLELTDSTAIRMRVADNFIKYFNIQIK